MEREFNRENLQRVYQMLFEIAKGNLEYRIKRTDHKDELEGLIALTNMTAEKLNKNRNQFLWFNRHNEIFIIRTASFLLNKNFKIIDYGYEFNQNHHCSNPKEILNKPFEELLAKESRPRWNKCLKALCKQKQIFSSIQLQYQLKDLLHLKLDSVIVKISTGTKVKFVVTSFLLDMEKDQSFNLKGNPAVESFSQWDQKLFQEIQEFIMRHLEEPLKPNYELASDFNINEHKLNTGFKKIFGLTPFQYHDEKRIEQSQLLIRNTDLSLKEIAIKMGFPFYARFYEHFKRKTGMAPRNFKNIFRNSEN